jgi:hypothetical protein
LKIGVVSCLGMGDATALQSKPQSGYSAKPQGDDPKGCAP